MKRKRKSGTARPAFCTVPDSASAPSGLRDRACVAACQSAPLKIFHFTEIRFRRMCRPSRLDLEGRSRVVTFREPDLRWTRQRRHEKVAGRAGRPCEPETACGRATLNAYGKTVWSWPSLLRSSPAKVRASPTGRTASSNSRGEGGQKEWSAPGRSRHKPSSHCAGKAE